MGESVDVINDKYYPSPPLHLAVFLSLFNLHSSVAMIQLALWLLTASAAGVLGQANDFQQPLTAKPSSIPSLGFGTWNLDRSNVSAAVSAALQAGFRHIDCATVYGNQKEVGKGIADGLKKTGLKRSDIWVTSKLWNDQSVWPISASQLEGIILKYR